MVIVPEAGLVAVRQINAEDNEGRAGEGDRDFVDRVIILAEASGRLGAP